MIHDMHHCNVFWRPSSWLVASDVKPVNTSFATKRLLGPWCNVKWCISWIDSLIEKGMFRSSNVVITKMRYWWFILYFGELIHTTFYFLDLNFRKGEKWHRNGPLSGSKISRNPLTAFWISVNKQFTIDIVVRVKNNINEHFPRSILWDQNCSWADTISNHEDEKYTQEVHHVYELKDNRRRIINWSYSIKVDTYGTCGP